MKTFRVVVRVLVWLLFGAALYLTPALGEQLKLEVCDIILILALLFAIVLGITFSLAYNYQMDGVEDTLLKKAIRLQLTYLHASSCWNIAYIFMVFVPLYTTCSVIYLSLDAPNNDKRILLYSILSLVFSLGVYVVRPQTRSTAYRNSYVLLRDATLACELEQNDPGDKPPSPESPAQRLRKSIKEAEETSASHYNQSQT